MSQNRHRKHHSKRRGGQRASDQDRKARKNEPGRGSQRRGKDTSLSRERRRKRSPWSTRTDGPRVWMMPRDADFALVYWDVTEAAVTAAIDQLERISPTAQLVLRVRCGGEHHAAGAGSRTFDIPLDDWSGERYIPLGPPGHEHFCSVGLRTLDSEQGLYVPLARSNRICSPNYFVSLPDPMR